MAVKLSIKKVNYTVLRKLSIIFLGCFVAFNFVNHPVKSHNCRFWGLVFIGDLNSEWEATVRSHLDSLKGLSSTNDDGWGIGYYVSPYEGIRLPVISRGEPKALMDPRYDKTVDEMITYITGGCVAHVRKGSSGPLGGYPNPHPFRRISVNNLRPFDMLFAHNGTIKTNLLLALIGDEYLENNPPDYTDIYNVPNLDSDLYAIYIMKTIDDYPTYSIDSCIVMAVNNLALYLHQNGEFALLNFVMTDGSDLWALCFADTNTTYYTLYYFPSEATSEKWVAASQPLDNNLTSWVQVPNYTLVTLIPNEAPKIYSFEEQNYKKIPSKPFVFEKLYPNPCRDIIKIRYNSPDPHKVVITLYDAAGRLVKKVFDGRSKVGMNEILYSTQNLSNGIYFVRLKIEEKQMVQKVILQH